MTAADLGLLAGIASGTNFNAFWEKLVVDGARPGVFLETHLADRY